MHNIAFSNDGTKVAASGVSSRIFQDSSSHWYASSRPDSERTVYLLTFTYNGDTLSFDGYPSYPEKIVISSHIAESMVVYDDTIYVSGTHSWYKASSSSDNTARKQTSAWKFDGTNVATYAVGGSVKYAHVYSISLFSGSYFKLTNDKLYIQDAYQYGPKVAGTLSQLTRKFLVVVPIAPTQ